MADSLWSSYWGRHFGRDFQTDGLLVSPRVKRYVSNGVKAVLDHPQAKGNHFSYKTAIPILGLQLEELYRDGRTDLDPAEYTDMGFMVSMIGPPESALDEMRRRIDADTIGPYPPDLLYELREIVAAEKFERPRSEQFEVMGVEGAQGGIGFTVLAFLNPGDEVIVTDPGYMHFPVGPLIVGAGVRAVRVTAANGYRLSVADVARAVSPRTKLLVVCDPLNPFGTIQSRDELRELVELARRHEFLVMNNITHNTYCIDPATRQLPIASLWREVDTDHVISVCGISKGYGMAAVRLGFVAGHPDLLKAIAAVKTEITKIHTNLLGQYGALAALKDRAYVASATAIMRRNFEHIRQTVAATEGVDIPVAPAFGFSMVLDVGGTGVSAQELTVALFRNRVAVVPGDAFGDVGTTRYIRLNFSQPDIRHLERFRQALPLAIEEARTGRYRAGVMAFYERQSSDRARRILRELAGGVAEQPLEVGA